MHVPYKMYALNNICPNYILDTLRNKENVICKTAMQHGKQCISGFQFAFCKTCAKFGAT